MSVAFSVRCEALVVSSSEASFFAGGLPCQQIPCLIVALAGFSGGLDGGFSQFLLQGCG